MHPELPKDPHLLLSTVNMKLRNQFSSLEKLCRYYDIDEDTLTSRLASIDYLYDRENNQFR